MKTKLLVILLVLGLTTVLFAGCNKQAAPAPAPATGTKADATSSASVVDNAADFEKAIAKDGNWIIAITKDVTTDKELVLDGEFLNGKKDKDGKDIVQRKVALYTQDENRNVTARFTLTAPKFTINSPNGSIEQGTFKGDVYVNANGFKLKGATIEGNIYFASDEIKSTYVADDKSTVTGTQEVKK